MAMQETIDVKKGRGKIVVIMSLLIAVVTITILLARSGILVLPDTYNVVQFMNG
jgi:hypothetical protein